MVYAMKYHSAFKSKEILLHATTWMNPKDTFLSEISESPKNRYCVISVV